MLPIANGHCISTARTYICPLCVYSKVFHLDLHKIYINYSLLLLSLFVCFFFCLYSILERIPNAIEPHCYSFWIHKYKRFSAKVKCSPIFFCKSEEKKRADLAFFGRKFIFCLHSSISATESLTYNGWEKSMLDMGTLTIDCLVFPCETCYRTAYTLLFSNANRNEDAWNCSLVRRFFLLKGKKRHDENKQ